MSDQVYGPKIFVGREQEIAAFEQVLDSQNGSQWMINVHGPGGIGKTQLLHKFVKIVEERKAQGDDWLVTKEFVDLYWTENRRTLGMLKNIADQLASELFTGFYHELARYNGLLGQQALSEQSLLREQEEKTRAAFFEIYKNLPAKWIILIFDTTELAAEAAFGLWRSFSLLSNDSKHKTLLVLAGRKRLDIFPEKDCKWLPVVGLSPDQVRLYFENVNIDLAPDVIKKVAELSQGRPILIALTVDWLHFGRFPDSLIDYTPEQFEQAMVEPVQQLQFPEDQIILAMAHFYRRFDEQLLSYVLEKVLKRSPSNPAEEIESLARYSFVKYHPPINGKPGSCVLHDEMCDLVEKYIWSALDPRKEERREWSREILGYYAQKIEQERNESERLYLSLERLFYWLDVDLEQAFTYSRGLAEQAMCRYDFDFIQSLNNEFAGVKHKLPPYLEAELALRDAMVLYTNDKTPGAKQLVNNIEEYFPKMPLLFLVWLIEFFADGGEPGRALAINTQNNLEEKLQQSLQDIAEPDAETKRWSELALGMLYNNLGFAARAQGHFSTTVGYYEKALKYFQDAGQAFAQIARTRNNLGYVLHRLGRDDEALSHCEIALTLRQRLQNPYETGLSFNVMGLIYTDLMRVEEAINKFREAVQAFEQAHSDRGKALVFIAYGRLMRQLGWYKEDFAKERFNPEREEYRLAGELLDNAIVILHDASDFYNLCDVLNEKGTLLRQQKKWGAALSCYDESIRLAKHIGNTYHEIDSMQDIGILYEFWGMEDKALEYAQNASKMAWEEKTYYLYARTQRTIGNALFNQKKYDEAFESVANACIYILQPDPNAPGHSSSKKDLVYDKFEDWASELILKLPTHDLAKRKCQYLIARWKKEKQAGKRLAKLYPGFITKMNSRITDYPLLSSGGEEDHKE